jgi:hypothetical protein
MHSSTHRSPSALGYAAVFYNLGERSAIHLAFRRLCLLIHPDKCPTSRSKEAMLFLHEAYKAMKDTRC